MLCHGAWLHFFDRSTSRRLQDQHDGKGYGASEQIRDRCAGHPISRGQHTYGRNRESHPFYLNHQECTQSARGQESETRSKGARPNHDRDCINTCGRCIDDERRPIQQFDEDGCGYKDDNATCGRCRNPSGCNEAGDPYEARPAALGKLPTTFKPPRAAGPNRTPAKIR
jgi:hypothetical protein